MNGSERRQGECWATHAPPPSFPHIYPHLGVGHAMAVVDTAHVLHENVYFCPGLGVCYINGGGADSIRGTCKGACGEVSAPHLLRKPRQMFVIRQRKPEMRDTVVLPFTKS
jgi:hypothetical protein